jgi:hypothetical protein
MTSTFSTNKNLELPGNGDYVNTWNVPVNGDLSVIDAAFGGTTNLNATSGSATLTYTQYRPLILNITGSITADVTYTIPTGVGGQWVINNATTTSNASRVIFASGGGGATQVAARGAQIAIACNGTDIWTVSSVGSSVPTGGGTDAIFYNNGQTVTVDYTIPTANNSGTFGPISINTGATVTIPSGSTWTVI